MHNPAPPLFSVVTVCYNAESHIEKCIRSVAEQDYQDFEYIIIDGASTDRTLEIVESLKPLFGARIIVQSEPDGGIYDAMNKGAALAKGEFVGFLNADDWYEPSALSSLQEAIESNPGPVQCVGGATRVVSGVTEVRILHPNASILADIHPQKMAVGHQSLFVTKVALEAVGGFRTEFRIAADYDMFLRLHAHSYTWAFTDSIISNFALGGASYDSVTTARDYRRVRIANSWPMLVAGALYAKNIISSIVVRTSQEVATKRRDAGSEPTR